MIQKYKNFTYSLEYDTIPIKKKTKKLIYNTIYLGFPDSSVGKESTCNAGDPSLIPGSGRSTGEGTGYPLQYS